MQQDEISGKSEGVKMQGRCDVCVCKWSIQRGP